MAERSISVVMESSYRSGLSKGLRQDKQKLDEFQKYLDKRGLRIPVRIDLKGLQSQAGAMRKIVLGAFADIPAAILGADGRPASSASSGRAGNSRPGLLSRTTSSTYGKNAQTRITEVEQIGKGVTSSQTFKRGSTEPLSTITKDISNVNDLRDALRGMNEQLRQAYGTARGRGDKAGQIAALIEHRKLLTAAMQSASGKGLENSPHYIQAENQVARVSERIAALQGGQQSRAEKEAAATARSRFDNKLRREEERVDLAQKANAQEIIRANQIANLTQREAALNRLYAERKQIFTDSQRRFQSVDAARQGMGDAQGADKAMRRGLNMAGHAAQVDVEAERARASLASHRSAERKAQDAKDHADRTASFNRELQDIKAQSEMRLAAINATERAERAAARNARAKNAAAEKGHLARQAEYANRASLLGGLDTRARAAGNTGSADAARAQRLRSEVAGARDLARFTSAATAGGHALNFHSSALLRNAATFTRWMIPVQAVLGVVSALRAGADGAIKVNRQFAVLQAVFQGTAQEAQKLKVGVLDLAASQGRSADEAMDAAIRWSRLGLSRVGVLEAVKVSLQAANVAEISSAEAAEQLAAIYATFRLNVGDLAGVLNSLNSISNNYNVTVDDMFQGISRVGGIAKQSGLDLMDLAGIIGSVVGATGRPGQEVGNAVKFVVTRLAAPETLKGLKEHFKIDLSQPNGDLKDMSTIIRELADIFPTLNNAQKQTFLSLTAGSRQASRFALVLDQYRQGQALAAQAMNDTGVTAAENQLILETLEGRIKSLKTAWTELFTAMGDAGAFERVGEFFRYLQGHTMQSTAAFKEAAKASGSIAVNNPAIAELIERQGGGKDKALGTRGKFTREEVQKTLEIMDKFVPEAKAGKHIEPNQLKGRVRIKAESWFGLGGNTVFASPAEAEQVRDELKKLLDNGGDSGPQDRISAMTAPTTYMRNRMRQMDTFRANMESFSKEVANGKMAPDKRYRDFETTARGLQNLPGGNELYSKAIADYQRLAKAKDNAGISKLASNTADQFHADFLKTSKGYDAAKPGVISGLEKTLTENADKRQALVKDLAAAPVGDKMKIVGELKELDQVSASVARELEAIRDGVKELMDSFFSLAENTSISKTLDDMVGGVGDNAKDLAKSLAGQFAEAFKNLAPDAENDPVERIFKRRASAARIALDMLRNLQAATAATSLDRKTQAEVNIANIKSTQAAGRMDEVAADKAIAAQQKIINQQDALNELIQTRLNMEDESLRKKLDELSIEQQAAALARIQTDASKRTADSSLAWRFGETDSDKNANQAAMAIRRANATLFLARDAMFPGSKTDTLAARAENAGSVLQDEATARKALESLQTRGYEIEAARKQVAIDTLKAMREQTDEANKRLMLASREDQLRIAAFARTARERPVRGSEFYALSQETRQAIVNYMPNQAPGRANPAFAKADKDIADLDEEKGRLVSAISDIRGGLEALGKSITKETGDGGALDATPKTTGEDLQKSIATRDNSPVVNVSIGAISVGVGQQVERMLTGYVDRELSAMETRLSRRPQPSPVPHAQGVTE